MNRNDHYQRSTNNPSFGFSTNERSHRNDHYGGSRPNIPNEYQFNNLQGLDFDTGRTNPWLNRFSKDYQKDAKAKQLWVKRIL